MLKQKRKFSKKYYDYDLTAERLQCGADDCDNKTTEVFCNYNCWRRTKRRKAKTNDVILYQLRCVMCNHYYVNKYANKVYCGTVCQSKNQREKDSARKRKEKIGASCQGLMCNNLYITVSTKYNKYCSTKCRSHISEHNKRNKGKQPYWEKCEYRYCDNTFFINYTIKSPSSKKFCRSVCATMEHHYKYRLPARWRTRAGQPMFLYVMYNKKYDSYKFGITNHKQKRIARHNLQGFELLETRYYPKYATKVEQSFKHYLKLHNIKPHMSYIHMKDGWSETVSAEDIPNLSIDMISKIYKEKGKV